MNEVIIFSNINQFPLLRQLASYGVDTLGYRIFNNSTILSYIEENTGNLSSKKMIMSKEKSYLYNKFLKEDNSYFEGTNYETAKSLSETIDSIRELITDDEEKTFKDKLTNNQLFKEKYEAIYSFYKKYVDYLNLNNSEDLISKTRNMIKSNLKIDKEIIIFKEEDISPLNKKLLESVFKNIKIIEYRNLFKTEKKQINFKNLYRSKGYTHEVSNVFNIIISNKLPLDKCTIVYTNYNNYYNSIKEYSSMLSLPVSYIDGVPALEYNSYRMLYLITKLNDGLYGYDVLMNLIKDKSFNYNKLINDLEVKEYLNSFLEEIGDLKFNFDPIYNNKVYSQYIIGNKHHVEEINKFKEIFSKGIIYLINEYLIDDNPSITSSLIKEIALYKSINNTDDFDFYKSLLTKNINGSVAKEGTISVCSIGKVRENIRENMFFIGNDSDSFHISLAENSFISDDKYDEFYKDSVHTSINKALKKREQYKNAIQLAFDLGSNVYISYSEKDEAELKNHNFISLLYDLQKESNNNITFEKFKEDFLPINTYFGNNLRKDEKIIETYLDKTKYINEEVTIKENEDKINDLIKNRYAPTEIEIGLNCKKRFLIERILKINTKEEYDVFDKFTHADLGTMFHKAMEEFNNDKSKTKEDLLFDADRIFKNMRAKRNPILNYELDKEKKDFLRLVEYGYDYLKKKKQGIAENWQEVNIDINGTELLLKGKADLLSGNEIIDYKAKKTITHKDDDSESCIQALIYALMNSDSNIDHVEYYYPYFNRTIKTINNELDTKTKLKSFVDFIVDSDFDSAIDMYTGTEKEKKLKDICQYCSFKDVCEDK